MSASIFGLLGYATGASFRPVIHLGKFNGSNYPKTIRAIQGVVGYLVADSYTFLPTTYQGILLCGMGFIIMSSFITLDEDERLGRL